LIVDTHILIWALGQPDRLSKELRNELNDPEIAPYFSVISIWEIAIKAARHKSFAVDANRMRQVLLRDGWRELSFQADHASVAGKLPLLHGDPFDRALIAQAMVEKQTLVTADAGLAEYGTTVRLVKVAPA
jgi:PIN domain nuclease of toxin-antitoxin system